MIKVNGKTIEVGTFGDGTLKCKIPDFIQGFEGDSIRITWCYDNDAELLSLICIVRHAQEHCSFPIELIMPYIPHARQDRVVSERIFTLKYFAEVINSLNFEEVYVLDPHSDVATALINRVRVMPLPFAVGSSSTNVATIMFPDNGAAKKYAELYRLDLQDNPFIVGNKKRDKDGRIVSYELMNFVDGTKEVIIRDDICSYGGTFVAAAKELRKRGVEKITLVVSHCENNILKGEVFDWIDRVFTTDSICTVEHPKLTVEKVYRGNHV